MKSLAILCLLANCVLAAHFGAISAVHDFMDKATDKIQSLESELASGGLEEPQALSGLLTGLGLHFMQDIRRLNEPELLELAESLQSAGVNLGSRSKLRLLAHVDAAADHALDLMAIGTGAPLRQMQDQPTSAATAKSDGGGFSVETLAIMVTALLGLASYRPSSRGTRRTRRRITTATWRIGRRRSGRPRCSWNGSGRRMRQ
jgi:hypothetical protein